MVLEKYMRKLKLYVILILFLIGVNCLIVERYWVRFQEYEFKSEKITKDFDGYRIAVVSDLHYGF